MYEFRYHRPGTVRQAANLLVKNEDAKVIAGGHTLIPVMKQRLASPPHLVDLSHIEGLNTIEMKGRSLVIGATARHAEVANSAVVGSHCPCGPSGVRLPHRSCCPARPVPRRPFDAEGDAGRQLLPCTLLAPPPPIAPTFVTRAPSSGQGCLSLGRNKS